MAHSHAHCWFCHVAAQVSRLLMFSVLVVRKLVLGVSDAVRLSPVYSATEISWNIGILHESLAVVFSRVRKALTRLHEQAGKRLCCSYATQ